MYLEYHKKYLLEFNLLVATDTDLNILNDNCTVEGGGREVNLEELQTDVAKGLLENVIKNGVIVGVDQDGRITYYNFDKVESVTFDFKELKECD